MAIPSFQKLLPNKRVREGGIRLAGPRFETEGQVRRLEVDTAQGLVGKVRHLRVFIDAAMR